MLTNAALLLLRLVAKATVLVCLPLVGAYANLRMASAAFPGRVETTWAAAGALYLCVLAAVLAAFVLLRRKAIRRRRPA